MSSPTPQRRSAGEAKKPAPPSSSIVTRNGARKAKIVTRAMSAGSNAQPSAVVVAAKKKAQQKKKHSNVDTVIKDHYQLAIDCKARFKGPTGFVSEPRMSNHRCLWDRNYPECPERLTGIISRCKDLISKCKSFVPRAATKEELCVLHSPAVFEMMETTDINNDIQYLEDLSSRYDAIYVHPSTHELSLIAAGSTIDMVDRILVGEVQNGCAFIRPPGHHAMRAEPCGYCFYNNVALAAKHALTKRGITRILIVDWDVHHGQATQQMFYNDPRVLYFSIHRYEHGSFWPNLRQSDFHYVGCGRGKGYNVNVPLNKTGMKDADYLAIWHQLLMPIALEYQPELILVSAGYDAAVGCPEGEMEVTPSCYAHLTQMLMSVCPSLCVVLEGGYCIPSLAEGAYMTLRTLLGIPPTLAFERLDAYVPCDSIVETILNCIYALKPYWKCFNYQPTYSIDCTVKNVDDEKKQKHTVKVVWEGDETRPSRFPTRDCYPKADAEQKKNVRKKLDGLRLLMDLRIPEYQVGYIFDEAMLKHKNVLEPGHVECPERLLRVHERHRDFFLLDRVHQLNPRVATEEELLTVHTPKHLESLKDLASMKVKDLTAKTKEYDSVYFHSDSFESAAIAAGCVLQMVDAVLSNHVNSGVCVVRPPGHHADEEVPSGFCLLNNVAIAATYAVNSHGLKRVLILDWDVHHGNGTQSITYQDHRILYMSIHRYDNATFFPHQIDADYGAVGEGKGEGFNVNVPWNKRGMGDAEYMAAFTQVVLPIAYEFNPELVIVSAGFDACVGDPLGGCKVSPECFGRMTYLLRGLAGGRIVMALEGGYNVTSTALAYVLCTKALFGDPLLHHYDPKMTYHPSAVESINNVIRIHKKYWKSLRFQVALPIENVLEEPLPSRGLTIRDDAASFDHMKLSEMSIANALDTPDRSKSVSEVDGSLQMHMEKLSLNKSKCSDGVHCGTDDENDGKKTENPCEKPAASSKTECDKKIAYQGDASKTHRSSATKRHSGDKGGSSSSKHQGNEDDSKKTEKLCEKPAACSKTECDKKSRRSSPTKRHSAEKGGSSSSKHQEVPATKETEQSGSGKPSEKSDNPTLVDYLAENMQAIVDGEMFAVIPMPWCPHLESMFAIPTGVKFEQGTKCVDCDHTVENWVCLHCYITACGRSINAHMQAHYRTTGHALVLSLSDLSVWCNECDAYVDNALLYDAKNNAHRCKFGEDMPWCYRSDTLQLH